jgi:translation elongation factor EF-1beta
MPEVGEKGSQSVAERAEYSAYVEAANTLQEKLVNLRAAIQAKAHQRIPELKGGESDTFNELEKDLDEYVRMINHHSLNQELRQKIARHIETLQVTIQRLDKELGLSEMEEQLQTIELSRQILLALDRKYDNVLRSKNVDGYLETDV